MKQDDELERRIRRQGQRLDRAKRERRSLLAETVHVGTLGLVFVLPVVAGAYLGRWLDSLMSGYSMRWTLSLIIVGVAVGIYSVYRTLKEP
ncbi:AtpZ/AtpI family protein [Mangrovitalea sediminis]|uniref:AtpZ/AtpI family protein n=1 Tax=Mangrovitalea sediminis TaxID=1982043 RepID=UPI000BE516B9|nr:AtpZ/AtpI family protein [Mangrovitalea sediminis]